LAAEEAPINISIRLEKQILTTKFFLPVALHTLIARPRLSVLLNESLKCPLTLVSAPAGFGKTTSLATWAQSLLVNNAQLAWISLDEEDNEPQWFWSNVLIALTMQQPERFMPLLKYLQSPQTPPLKQVLTVLINLLIDSPEHFVLILDDYHLITEPQIHTTLAYLVEHLPAQLHLILATRIDPPLPLPLLQTRDLVRQVRIDQLRCTEEETKAFLQEVMGIELPDETIEEVTTRTEGWLVGLQLLGLSLPGCPDPITLLEELSGDQRYILDFLTEEIFQKQSQEVQTFLLSTCILERFTASLCDAVVKQTGSQLMLEQIERANLFVVSLDNKRQWYRYHTLFAEALRYRLEQMHANLVPTLHYRASLWYADHNQTTQAILHAFSAHQWQWAADLIERLPVMSLTWGAGEHELVLLRHWLEQLPVDIVRSRPRLCLACAQMLWSSASPAMLQDWLDMAEATLTASLPGHAHVSQPILAPQERLEQENLLGEVIAFRAYLQGFQGNGVAVLELCQQAFSLLSEGNVLVRTHLSFAQMMAYYTSANDAVAAVENMFHGSVLAQKAGYAALAIGAMGVTVCCMTTVGRLGEAYRLAQQGICLGTQPGGFRLPDVGWLMIWQADVLREWGQLDAARVLTEESISLCQQAGLFASSVYLVCGYATLAHICLSHGELDIVRSALQQVERIGQNMNQPIYLYFRSLYTTVDQIRFWLACGELDRAIEWAKALDLVEPRGTPFAREREEVARVRFLLATAQPTAALQRLEPVLEKATAGQRWSHVIEIRLLQALAYQMCHEQTQAIAVLSEAVRLAEPEGYIRSFVDEGAPMAALLSQLREQRRKDGPTPYLDAVLAVFSLQSMGNELHLKRKREHKAQPLQDPLTEREMEVLQVLAHGASNQQIAQELGITVGTVKRHISQILSKLGVQSRIQAVNRVMELGLFEKNG
jgi:LuxR family maltose regulon positive regulatory protein